MRVISGRAKSLRLKTIEGNDTRPTTDRIKETLFNMIHDDMYGCRFLDLFSGSGAIGIEALSRGAKKAVFVEINPKAVMCIKENLQFTRLQDKAEVMSMKAESAINILGTKNEVFDYIFMDPPYNCAHEKNVLKILSKSSIMDENTVVIAECSKQTDMSYIGDTGFKLIKEKIYKTNKHVFMQKEKM